MPKSTFVPMPMCSSGLKVLYPRNNLRLIPVHQATDPRGSFVTEDGSIVGSAYGLKLDPTDGVKEGELLGIKLCCFCGWNERRYYVAGNQMWLRA